MQLALSLQILLLLVAANGAPLIAKKLLGGALDAPLDGGVRFVDGLPLFGASKTIRGFVVGLLAAMLIAPLIGLDWTTGLVVGPAAMAGDIFTSFAKRRMGLPPSSQALGLDHIPESLFPALAAMPLVGLTLFDVAVITAAFVVGGLALSIVLFKLNLRDEPY